MAGNFEIDEQGLVKAEVGIRGILGKRNRVVNLVNRAALAAMITMKAQAPEGDTGAFARAIEKTRPEFRPGGAGGGGTWVCVVGVTRTPETTVDGGFSYPTNVFQGTGLFGPRGRVIKAAPGNVMVFPVKIHFGRTIAAISAGARGRVAKPGVVFAKTVRGQQAQTDWYDAGRDRAQLIISSNLHRVFNIHDSMSDI